MSVEKGRNKSQPGILASIFGKFNRGKKNSIESRFPISSAFFRPLAKSENFVTLSVGPGVSFSALLVDFMPTSPFQYEMLPTTWFFVSTLIILAVFFKFNRFLSVRNLDLIGLILLTPGLTSLAMRDDQWGYAWLFAVGVLMAIRMLFDTVMVRRPLLEPNLTPGGLTFSCFFLLFFVFAALLINRGDQPDTIRTVRLEQILTTRHLKQGIGMNPTTLTFPADELPNVPPGFLPFHALSEATNLLILPSLKIREEILRASGQLPPAPEPTPGDSALEVPPIPQLLSAETSEKPVPAQGLQPVRIPGVGLFVLGVGAVLFGHLAIVFALIYIGHCHFGNIRTGIACATLYLLHPYVNQMVARLDHLIPAALILWAVAMYRRPFFAGLWIGTAAALVFYPIFLLPLWCSFYWKRGWIRFLCGTVAAFALFAVFLLFSPTSLGSYGCQLLHLVGKSCLLIFTRPEGFWTADDQIYRVPVMAVFFVFCFGMIIWPSHKHLATLLACSAFLLLAVQYWQVHQGGLFMAWYLPLMILTIFRPNLEDRVAQSTVAL